MCHRLAGATSSESQSVSGNLFNVHGVVRGWAAAFAAIVAGKQPARVARLYVVGMFDEVMLTTELTREDRLRVLPSQIAEVIGGALTFPRVSSNANRRASLSGETSANSTPWSIIPVPSCWMAVGAPFRCN